ncbi:hypothetical protein HMN09_01224400 [Mycena chlorophos]|uniref:Gfd2/YDR514C-like C-terminal domain-containing protein n=1 Tax=Mycena chlorophos TaxID=658473 RepID=A0A8H6S4X3_MYCCL|nr:hypothetical protein HMN09_01224400 [Mycena chlorophos]
MSQTSVASYYRYNDVWFKWTELLPAEQRDPLKGLLAHDSLVHPDHPLHPGVQGITMWKGKLKENNEARYLFSSKQIDYCRYWLHAAGITKDVIPVLHSDCLVTVDDLHSVEEVTFMTGGELKMASKQIDKDNKKAKNASPTLAAQRIGFDRTRAAWMARKGTFIAVDFEEYEGDHNLILEFGYGSVRFDAEGEHEEHAHIVLESSKYYRNGRFVKDNRDRYQFGQTTTLSGRAALKNKIADLIEQAKSVGPVFLVFHDYSQDIKTLKRLEAPIDGIFTELPVTPPTEGLYLIDTGHLFGALIGEGSGNRRGLQQVCNHLKIENANDMTLHNAGNDAAFTLTALRRMVGGEPLDVLREKMWPNQASGLAVQFRPYEEDPDYSDQEGV